MPKGFNKWSAQEQESWLVKRLQEYYAVESQISKMLASIRGGQRLQVSEIERPDELMLKAV
jgi:predicted phage-related endonuclease